MLQDKHFLARNNFTVLICDVDFNILLYKKMFSIGNVIWSYLCQHIQLILKSLFVLNYMTKQRIKIIRQTTWESIKSFLKLNNLLQIFCFSFFHKYNRGFKYLSKYWMSSDMFIQQNTFGLFVLVVNITYNKYYLSR